MSDQSNAVVVSESLAGKHALALLEAISEWGNVTTIVLHAGCVFEYKGPFPKGTMGEGFYNLDGPVPGFHGHLNLSKVARIEFQDRAQRGRQSYAFVFTSESNECMFKVFLGRDELGELIGPQVAAFKKIQATLTV